MTPYVTELSNESANNRRRAFADSKTLTSERRDKLYDQIEKDDMIGFNADEISASFISGGMLGCQKVSLNAMANESTYKLIRSVLDAGVNLQEVYVDTVGDAGIYQQKLSREFPGIQFTVCPKADALYPIVSAASIVAKVKRDRAIANNEGLTDVGSGYPGDPATKAWLEANINNTFGYSNDVRFSWSTCVTLMEKNCIKVDWEADDDSPGGQPSLAAMMSGGGSGGKKMKPRHSYFRARKLQKVIAGW